MLNRRVSAPWLLLTAAVISCGSATPKRAPLDAGSKTPRNVDAGRSTDSGSSDAGSNDAGACEQRIGPAGLSWKVSGFLPDRSPYRRSYDGWALVEQSSDSELVLAIMPGDQDADAGTPEGVVAMAHCNFAAPSELPNIGPGSLVWLHVRGEKTLPSELPHYGDEVTVRDSPGGAVLLAGIRAAANGQDRLEADALTFRNPLELCRKRARCVDDGDTVAYSIEAASEPPQRLAPGQHTTLQLEGMPYDVLFYGASRNTGTQRSRNNACLDHRLDSRLWVAANVRALEPGAAIARLSRGTLPTCMPGDAPYMWIDHSIYEIAVGDSVSVEVTYRERRDGQLRFDFPEPPGQLGIAESAPLAEPMPGQKLWLEGDASMFVLRERKSGPIVLAGGAISTYGQRVWLEELGRLLDTPVTVEPQCVYEASPIAGAPPDENSYLFRGTFNGTTVLSGTKKVLMIGGVSYDVSLGTYGSHVPFVISRRP